MKSFDACDFGGNVQLYSMTPMELKHPRTSSEKHTTHQLTKFAIYQMNTGKQVTHTSSTRYPLAYLYSRTSMDSNYQLL